MITNNIRELLKREPFVPFRMVMSSGKHYDVTNPEMTLVLKSEVFVVFADGDRWAHVPLLHIATVETAPNGRGRKNTRRKPK